MVDTINVVGQTATRWLSKLADSRHRYAPGLFMMEFVTIFFTLLEVYRSNRERRAISAAIADWERRTHGFDSVQPSLLQPTSKSESESERSQSNKADLYNMQALERALQSNPGDLLEFAATKQFTGENIVFLTRVRAWKERWNRATSAKTAMSLEAKSKLYEAGRDLFDRNVSLHTAQFPVNLESKIYRSLEGIFGSNLPCEPRFVITPFTEFWTAKRESKATGFEDITLSAAEDSKASADRILALPYGFDGDVFDLAERSVKYMVLTNTWARYLDSVCRNSALQQTFL